MKLIYFMNNKNNDIYPYIVGHYQCPSMNVFGPSIRKYDIIHFVLGGKGVLHNSKGDHPVKAGELFIIREGEVTTYEADKDEPWEYTWIGFTGERTTIFDNAPDVYKTPSELDKKLCKYVIEDEKSPDIYASILYELLFRLFPDYTVEPINERIRNVSKFIKSNYMDKISVAQLSTMFGIERSYLYRIFKEKYAIGPKEYLTQVRLENAKLYLQKGYSVTECAYMVGYSDAFSFSKAYKKYHGQSPSQHVPTKSN